MPQSVGWMVTSDEHYKSRQGIITTWQRKLGMVITVGTISSHHRREKGLQGHEQQINNNVTEKQQQC